MEDRRDSELKPAKPYIDQLALRATPHEDVAGWRATAHRKIPYGFLENAHPCGFWKF